MPIQFPERARGAPAGCDELHLRPGTALRVLLTAVICLGLAGMASAYVHHVLGRESAFGFVPTFDLDREGNVPSWFSALVLTACAGSLYVIYRAKALYLRFLLALPGRFRRLFVFAAVLFVGGAVGGELTSWGYRGPMLDAMPGDLDARLVASDSLTYALFAAGEEVCEMLGATVFLYALLAYLAAGRRTLMLRFGERPPVPGTWPCRARGR